MTLLAAVLRLSDRNAACFEGRREADPMVLGHQRRGGCARRERCRADQHRVRIDMTLRVGAVCYLLLPGPALFLVRSDGKRGGVHRRRHRH
jgi:hypothetical protein